MKNIISIFNLNDILFSRSHSIKDTITLKSLPRESLNHISSFLIKDDYKEWCRTSKIFYNQKIFNSIATIWAMKAYDYTLFSFGYVDQPEGFSIGRLPPSAHQIIYTLTPNKIIRNEVMGYVFHDARLRYLYQCVIIPRIMLNYAKGFGLILAGRFMPWGMTQMWGRVIFASAFCSSSFAFIAYGAGLLKEYYDYSQLKTKIKIATPSTARKQLENIYRFFNDRQSSDKKNDMDNAYQASSKRRI